MNPSPRQAAGYPAYAILDTGGLTHPLHPRARTPRCKQARNRVIQVRMTKLIRLEISRIKYAGDSVGDDIRIEVECLDRFMGLNMRLKRGNDRALNAEIGQFFADGASFTLPLNIKIIERDLVFNDAGNVQEQFKIDLNDLTPQRSTHKITVQERRGYLSKKKAVFEVTTEAMVSDAIKYLPDEDKGHGWLKVVLEDDRTSESLPAYVKVNIARTDNKRDYFTILEGPYRGRPVSISLKDDETSWLISGVTHEPAAQAKYSISQKTFILNGKRYITVDYPGSPWKKGFYDIEIPDYPHEGGRSYLAKSKRAMTWFRIGHGGERYLHAGGYSLGCITVTEITRWMEIYDALITARKDDGMSVGVLEVVD